MGRPKKDIKREVLNTTISPRSADILRGLAPQFGMSLGELVDLFVTRGLVGMKEEYRVKMPWDQPAE